MDITLIAAVARNGVIGRNGDLPWRLKSDLAFFKRTTLGHPIVMGRRTHESIGRRPLPKRTNIVVTRNADYAAPGCVVVDGLEAALAAARAEGAAELFIVGGAQLYREALPRAKRLLLSLVDASPDGETFFPWLDPSAWDAQTLEHHAAGPEDDHAFRVVEFRPNQG